MLTSSLINRFSPVSRRLAALLGIAAVAAVLAAPAAHADRKQGGGTEAAGCPVYNEDTGKTETVPVGTQVGLFTCGSDGEWHFGWLVNASSRVSKPRPPRHVLKVSGTNAVRVAKLAR